MQHQTAKAITPLHESYCYVSMFLIMFFDNLQFKAISKVIGEYNKFSL